MKRKILYIYTQEPNPFIVPPRLLFHGYKETCDAILEGKPEIHTTQMIMLSHMWIKYGYDIHLRDGVYEYVFDENWLESSLPVYPPTNEFFLLNTYRWGGINPPEDPNLPPQHPEFE